MKILALGTGSAFTMKNWQTNFLLTGTDNKTNLLLDCGSDIRFALAEQKLSYKDVQNVYVSHLHADHCGGLEYIAFCTFFDTSYHRFNVDKYNFEDRKPSLYGQSKLLTTLWNNTLSGGLGSVEGREMELEDYFTVYPMYVNKATTIPSLGTIHVIQTVHIMNGYGIVPTFGLMVETEDTKKKVYFTTDTQFNPDQIICFYNQADIIIQDCEIAAYESKVHAHYNKLKTLPDAVKAKMWLTHYGDTGTALASGDYFTAATKDGFAGFLTKGQIIHA